MSNPSFKHRDADNSMLPGISGACVAIFNFTINQQ